MEFVIIILSVFIAYAAVWITSPGVFSKEENGKKRITSIGWRFIVLGIATVLVTCYQSYNQDKEKEAIKKSNQEFLKKSLNEQEAIHQKNLNEREAATRKFMKDSIRNVAIEPILNICPDGITVTKEKNEYKVTYRLCSEDATSKDVSFNVRFVLYSESTKEYRAISGLHEGPSMMNLPSSITTAWLQDFVHITPPAGFELSVIFLCFSGDYYGQSGKKHSLNSLYANINLTTGLTGGVRGDERREILKALKKTP